MSNADGYYTKRLINNLKKISVESNLILPCPFKLKDAKIEYTYLGLFNWRETFDFLKKTSPDIIHIIYSIHTYLSSTFHLWLLLVVHTKLLKIPVFVTIQEAETWLRRLGFCGAVYYKLMSHFVDMFLVHAESSKQALVNNCKIPPTKVSHMFHGFHEIEPNTAPLEKIKTRWNLNENRVILFFGFIRPSKGIENLIEAVRIIRENRLLSNFIVLIVGSVRKREGLLNKLFQKRDERYNKYLKELVKKYSLDKVVKFIEEFIPDEEVFSVFSLSDVVVLPYNSAEESGILHIALSVPRPVIATNIGGIGERLKNIGVLVPPKSPQSLAEAITNVLSDNEFRENLIKRYTSLKESLSPIEIARIHYNLYKNYVLE